MKCNESECINLGIKGCQCSCLKILCDYHLKSHNELFKPEKLTLKQSQNSLQKLGDMKLEIISAAERIILKVHYHSSLLLQSLNSISTYMLTLEDLPNFKLNLQFEKKAIDSIEAYFNPYFIPASKSALSIIHVNQISIKNDLRDMLYNLEVQEFIKYRDIKEQAYKFKTELLDIKEEESKKVMMIIKDEYENIKSFFKKLKFEMENFVKLEKDFINKKYKELQSKEDKLIEKVQKFNANKEDLMIEKESFEIYIKDEKEKLNSCIRDEKEKLERNAAELNFRNNCKISIVALKTLSTSLNFTSKAKQFNISSEDTLKDKISKVTKLNLESFYEDYINNPYISKIDLCISLNQSHLFLCIIYAGTIHSDCTLNSDLIGKTHKDSGML